MRTIRSTVKQYELLVSTGELKPVFVLIQEALAVDRGISTLYFSGKKSSGEVEATVRNIINTLLKDKEGGKKEGQGMSNTDEKILMRLGVSFVKAAGHGDHDMVQEYIDNDFPVNFQEPSSLETALHAAAHQTDLKMLVDTGQCDLLLKDVFGKPAALNTLLAPGRSETEADRFLWDRTKEYAESKGIDFAEFVKESSQEAFPQLF